MKLQPLCMVFYECFVTYEKIFVDTTEPLDHTRANSRWSCYSRVLQ
jgi:hypothetical protein